MSLIKQRAVSGHGWTVDPIVNMVTALEVKSQKQSSRNEIASVVSESSKCINCFLTLSLEIKDYFLLRSAFPSKFSPAP